MSNEPVEKLESVFGEGVPSSADATAQKVGDLIRRRELAEGDALPPERELSELFGVSRATVRESLRTLEAYGVVARKPRGTVVASNEIDALLRAAVFRSAPDPQTYADVQEFRRVLETGLAPMILSRVTPADVIRLRRINANILADAPVRETAALDYEFHVRLVEISGNRTAAKVFMAIESLLQSVMVCGKDAEGRVITFQAHNAILEALENKALGDLEKAFEAHYEASLACISGSGKA